MILNSAPDDKGNLYKRLVSEDGKIEMGIYPVIYGFRVRAGIVGDMYYPLDWCGGDDLNQIQLLYSICKNILLKRDSLNPFKGLPGSSRVKPFYKDSNFTSTIIEAAGEIESVSSITREELISYKSDLMNQVSRMKDLINDIESEKSEPEINEETLWK